MGLISRYGKDLIGKIFVYRSRSGCNWCIGKVVRVEIYGVVYKPLGRSKDLLALPDSFAATSPIDLDSKLVKGSRRFERYLELFNGTN